MPPPAARPAATPLPPAVRAAQRPKTQGDVLAELEKIRRQAMKPAGGMPAAAPVPTAVAASSAAAAAAQAAGAAAANGKHEINREIQLTLKKADFDRAKRFLLTMHVEDGQQHVMEAVRDFQVDLGGLEQHQKVVLRLNIALRTKD
jgi:hypothetical protein